MTDTGNPFLPLALVPGQSSAICSLGNQWRPSDIFHPLVLPGFRPMRCAAAIQQTGGSAARTWHGHGRTHAKVAANPRPLNFDANVHESASRQSSDCSNALEAIAFPAATAPWGSSSVDLFADNCRPLRSSWVLGSSLSCVPYSDKVRITHCHPAALLILVQL